MQPIIKIQTLENFRKYVFDIIYHSKDIHIMGIAQIMLHPPMYNYNLSYQFHFIPLSSVNIHFNLTVSIMLTQIINSLHNQKL